MRNLIAALNHPATHVIIFILAMIFNILVLKHYHQPIAYDFFGGVLILVFFPLVLLFFLLPPFSLPPQFPSPLWFLVSSLLLLLSTEMGSIEIVRIVDGEEDRTINGITALPLTLGAFVQALSAFPAIMSLAACLAEWASPPMERLVQSIRQSIRPTKSGDSQ